MRRYRVRGGVLVFEPHVVSFDDYLKVPNTVHTIDFGNLKHISKPLHLEQTQIKSIDFKGVLTVGWVYLPKGCIVKENLYWALGIIGEDLEVCSTRMKYLNVYDISKRLIYLSGTVGGFLSLRYLQRKELLDLGYAVYSPGNHITFGDPVADEDPQLVYDIDIKAMESADIILFDLHNLSPGTCAELGYAIAKEWYKTKTLVGLVPPIQNFFIKGLAKYLRVVESFKDI